MMTRKKYDALSKILLDPEGWSGVLGVIVTDPDGWRGPTRNYEAKDWYDPIGIADGAQAMCDHQRSTPSQGFLQRGLHVRLVLVVEVAVASSRIITAGFFSSRRAMASRCFSPPLRR